MDPEIRIGEIDALGQLEITFTQDIEFPSDFAERLNSQISRYYERLNEHYSIPQQPS